MKYFLLLSLIALPLFALAQENTGFIPLTNTPFIEQAGNAVDLENMLNQLYRLCIGIAAVVAVLQIMRAGIMYMGGDSITEKKEAKNLIALSIGGLILVLSPVIVFSVINPEILSLKIGGIEKLRPASTSTASSTDTGGTGTGSGTGTGNGGTGTSGGSCPTGNVIAGQGACPAGYTAVTGACAVERGCTGVIAGNTCCVGAAPAQNDPSANAVPEGPQRFKLGYEIAQESGSCAFYVDMTLPNYDECIRVYAELGGQLLNEGKRVVIVKQCTSNELSRHALMNLPTCS